MANENKQAVVTAIWENPGRAFNCQFRKRGRCWENLKNEEYDEAGKIRLFLTKDGGNIMVFYNGASRSEQTDIFTYIGEYVLHNGGSFKETLQHLAETYGVKLKLSVEERQAATRAALAREVAASLVESLRQHPDGVTAKYLREVRGIEPDGVHFGELTRGSIAAARESLERRGIAYNVEDLRALGLRDDYAEQGFNCAIPYYVNGAVRGFVFRNTAPDSSDRYRYSQGLGRGGYCDVLTHGEPAVIVEGQIDAVRLIQAGITNVIAIGGAKIGDDIARLLKSHGITEVTYIPDLEYNAQGEKETELIKQSIRAFQSARADGEPVIKSLYIAELPAPDVDSLNGIKVDADSYGKEHGGEALAAVLSGCVPSWAWELDDLITWAKRQDNVRYSALQEKFNDIYSRIGSPYERQRLRGAIAGDPVYIAFGITPQALDDVDEWKRETEYNNRIKDGAAELEKAIREGASPDRIGRIVQDLNDAHSINTRDEWDAQLNRGFDDLLEAVKTQPETLKTKWEIGAIDKQGNFHKHDIIEFYPADIEVFCAPTSHGKTMILFQSALDLIRTTNKTYLYVSCEENERQLFERALNVYMDIDTNKDGKDAEGRYCFKEQTRRKTIKAVIRGDVPPYEYGGFMGKSEHYDALVRRVQEWLDSYKKKVYPRLKLIHTEATIESITANVIRTVEDYLARGVEVGCIFVDYMQLLSTENRNYSRHDELKDICKALKDCAARTELPIVIGAQLNREVLKQGIDAITVANIGEGADIERIAHDVYLVWQIDKTQESLYKHLNAQTEKMEINIKSLNTRSRRLYNQGQINTEWELKEGYIYIERMKARDGKTEGWGLLPYDGERGYIGETDKNKMAEK